MQREKAMKVRATVISEAEMLYTVAEAAAQVMGGCEDCYMIYGSADKELASVLPADHAARADKRYGAGLDFALCVAFATVKMGESYTSAPKGQHRPKAGRIATQ